MVVALLPIAAATGVLSAIQPAGVDTAVVHQVPSVLSGLSLATLEGPAPATTVMRVGVSVLLPDQAGQNQLYDEIYDPSSPQYHHFLTPAQFQQQFGLPSSEISAIESWLTSTGMSIDTSSPTGDYFTMSGTVAQIDSLFSVVIGRYSYNGVTFLANNVAPSVPVDLPIQGILGLDTVQRFSLSPLIGTYTNLPAGSPGQGPQPGTQETLTPQDLWGVYHDPGAAALTCPGDTHCTSAEAPGTSIPADVASSPLDLGQGQTIGVFGEGETSSVVDQLRLFEDTMGLPKVPTRTVYTEGAPASAYGDNTPAIEWYLDSQAATGMAPDVSQLDFYFSKSLYDADVAQEFDFWANDPSGPREMNASFGECEANPTNPVTGPLAQVPYGTEYGDDLEGYIDPVLRQATLEGRTLFTSAGDTGSGCPEVALPVVGAGNGVAVQPVPTVNYPCASPYAVCVGGTVVSVQGANYPQSAQRDAETSWTFGGGGTSFYIAEPGFQKSVANVDMPCVATPQGDPYPVGSEPTCRGVPDVSDMSGNVTGDAYFIFIDARPSSEGGTSLSSPLMVGQWARVQAGASPAVQKAGGLGFADQTIYDQASSADSCSSALTATAAATAACTSIPYAQDFNDVTESEYGAGNGAYQPGPGWDYASGWGSFDVTNLIADVDCHSQSDGCVTGLPPGTLYSLGRWNHAAGSYSGPILATEPYGVRPEPAQVGSLATLDGPQGWSTDPVDVSAVVPGPGQQSDGPPLPLPGDNDTNNYDPSLDITGATLAASNQSHCGTDAVAGICVTVTISGPYLGSLPPPTAGQGGDSFYVAWLYAGTVYYAQATEAALTGAWSFSSGNTTGGNYNDTASSAANGTLTQDGDVSTLTIYVPGSEVAPATSPLQAGSLLADPQAFSVLDVGSLDAAYLQLTTDSADDLVPVSDLQSTDCQATGSGVDELCGVAESQGIDVKVG
jgi:pseudomonalisin